MWADLKYVMSELVRLFRHHGCITPWQINRQLDIEERERCLQALTGPEHYDTAQRWIAWRRTWRDRVSYWEALTDEYEYAVRYGPHIIPPHPDKMPKEAP